MNRGSNKRSMTRFGKLPPDASAERGQAAAEGQVSRWPSLPKWPPLPGGATPAAQPSQKTPPAAPDEAARTEEQLAPPWEQPAAGIPKRPGRPFVALWGWLSSPSRRQPLGLVVVAGTVVITALLAVVVLGGILSAHTLNTGDASPTTGRVTNALGSPIAGDATATATIASATPAPPSFTITFTCASGSIGGRGMVCVHTLPNASVTLRVRYCDGAVAQGRGLHDSAIADGSGNHTWRWKVTTNCAGVATATVSAVSAGRTITQSTTFNITH